MWEGDEELLTDAGEVGLRRSARRSVQREGGSGGCRLSMLEYVLLCALPVYRLIGLFARCIFSIFQECKAKGKESNGVNYAEGEREEGEAASADQMGMDGREVNQFLEHKLRISLHT